MRIADPLDEAESEGPPSTPTPLQPMIGRWLGPRDHSSQLLSTLVSAALLTSGCSAASIRGQDDKTPGDTPLTDTRPDVRGPLTVVVQAGLPLVAGAACEPRDNRVCSVDGLSTYVPIEPRARAVVRRARTDLAPGSTSWTVRIVFRTADTRVVRRAADRARAAGGRLLLLTPDRVVVAAIAPADVRGHRIVHTSLTKPDAWQRIRDLTPGA